MPLLYTFFFLMNNFSVVRYGGGTNGVILYQRCGHSQCVCKMYLVGILWDSFIAIELKYTCNVELKAINARYVIACTRIDGLQSKSMSYNM